LSFGNQHADATHTSSEDPLQPRQLRAKLRPHLAAIGEHSAKATFQATQQMLTASPNEGRTMILGITIFTFVHVVLSLVGIFSGLVVVLGLLAAKRLEGWTALFWRPRF
jgi:hypothetical protein